MRLHIIGIPSAGKTTLASDISSRLGIAHHDLDSLAFVDQRWTLRPVADRDSMLDRILEEPHFVTEGGFLGWTERLFSAAEVILWLDPPLSVLTWRHVWRFRRHPLRLPSLLLFQVRSYRRPAGSGPFKGDLNQTRAGIRSALRPWADKVFRITRPISADEVITALTLSP